MISRSFAAVTCRAVISDVRRVCESDPQNPTSSDISSAAQRNKKMSFIFRLFIRERKRNKDQKSENVTEDLNIGEIMCGVKGQLRHGGGPVGGGTGGPSPCSFCQNVNVTFWSLILKIDINY